MGIRVGLTSVSCDFGTGRGRALKSSWGALCYVLCVACGCVCVCALVCAVAPGCHSGIGRAPRAHAHVYSQHIGQSEDASANALRHVHGKKASMDFNIEVFVVIACS